MQKTQIRKRSGQHHDVNLDPHSFEALEGCRAMHLEHSKEPFSISILVRRAIRCYRAMLEKLTREEMEKETKEAFNAAKGI